MKTIVLVLLAAGWTTSISDAQIINFQREREERPILNLIRAAIQSGQLPIPAPQVPPPAQPIVDPAFQPRNPPFVPRPQGGPSVFPPAQPPSQPMIAPPLTPRPQGGSSTPLPFSDPIRIPIPGQNPVLPGQPLPPQGAQLPQGPTMTRAELRDIDGMVTVLLSGCKELHDDYRRHFSGVRHTEKLDADVTTLENLASALHQFAARADGSPQTVARLRNDTNELIQHTVRIGRTLKLTEPWLRNRQAMVGLEHMNRIAGNIFQLAMQIDSYLPVDTQVVASQTAQLDRFVEELDAEFHEHFEGYQISRHLDQDIKELERLVDHMRALANGRTWRQIDFNHLLQDVKEVETKAQHIEAMFAQQAAIGIRARDWIGIEHARDAVTDVLASAYLLEHMIRKGNPAPQYQDPWGRPVRDRGAPHLHRLPENGNHGHSGSPTPASGHGFPSRPR